MESREESVKKLIDRLRNVILATQVIPFVYSMLYIITLVTYNLFGDEMKTVLDMLFYVSPVAILSFLVLSRVLHLCKWHRSACIIPLIPQIVSFFDYYIISFEEVYVHVFNGTIIVMSILLLVAAYNVFLK